MEIRNGGSEITLNTTKDRIEDYTCVAVQKFKTLTNKIQKNIAMNVECK